MNRRFRSQYVAFILLAAFGCSRSHSEAPPRVTSQGAMLVEALEPATDSRPLPAASAAGGSVAPPISRSATSSENKGPHASDRLLIYTANLSVRVTKQEEALRSCQDLAQKLGGYVLSLRGESIQIRVPSSEFFKTVDDIQALGTVVTHDVQAEDVSDQFHDLELRLKNARAVRDRLEQLLLKAVKVSDALEIQTELANLSERIELMEGQLRRIGELVRYSTINASFQQREVEQHVEAHLTLPFAWLDGLSLQQLMEVKQ